MGKIEKTKKTFNLHKYKIALNDAPPTNEEPITTNQDVEKERASFTYGTTPAEVIKAKVNAQAPNGYPMTIRSQNEWTAIAKAVNQGIDSHLEAFTRSKFNSNTGECLIHPEEIVTFLRRLDKNGDEESMSLRVAILETLGIEEI